MTNLEKIKKVCDRINAFGGTMVFPKFGNFRFAKHDSAFPTERNNMYLYHISSTTLFFCGCDKETGKADYENMWQMPLMDFSEHFLLSVFNELMSACKEQLTSDGYFKILKELEN